MFNKKSLAQIILFILLLSTTIILTACNAGIKVNVIFNSNGEVYETINTEKNMQFSFPKDPQKEGYIFDAWYYDNETWKNPLTMQSYLDTPITENTTVNVYAHFIKYYCGMDNKAHTYSHEITLAPTCTQNGLETYTCSTCGHSYTQRINKLGHSYTSEITTTPTCTEDGVKTYTCSICGHSYTQQINSPGHQYKSEITTAPTCTEDGVITHTCSTCEHTCTNTLPAIGHSYTSEITTTPTCTEGGVTTYTCSICGHTYTNIIPAIEHLYTSAITTEPTCTEKGEKTFTCSHCLDSYTEEIDALGHNYERIITKEPCVETGIAISTCSICGDIHTEILPAIGYHNCDTAGNCLHCGAESCCTADLVYTNNKNGTCSLSGCNSTDPHIVIPSMHNGKIVTKLGMAFANCTTVKSVYIPDSVTSIDYGSFMGCFYMTSVRMPKDITIIGGSAFGYTKIISIYIPKSVTMIESAAFMQCTSLQNVYYEGTATEWNEIFIGGNNVDFVSATRTYNYVRE